NRVEGLPVVFGPMFDWKLQENLRFRLDALGVFRTAGDLTDRRSDLGYMLRTELRSGEVPAYGAEFRAYDVVLPVEDWGLRGAEVSPQTGVPAAVRGPIPTDGSYQFTRAFFDVRRYSCVSPSGRVNLRLLAGGWLGGDPLPLQRRLSTGGADPLAGYGFRRSACNRDITDAAFASTLVAACDRVILVQAEYRGHISLHWAYNSSRPEDEES